MHVGHIKKRFGEFDASSSWAEVNIDVTSPLNDSRWQEHTNN